MIPSVRSTAVFLVLSALAAGTWSGCRREESIRQYSVPKSSASSEMPKPTRVPAGPLLSGANAWFFKLMGPTDAVLKEALSFRDLVRSLQFSEDGTPRYQVPEKWTASNGPPPRYQTLKIPDADPPLETTVSTLPVMGSDTGKYLLDNINRWREQVNLPPLDQENWMEAARARGEVIIVPVQSRQVAMINLNGDVKDQGATRILGAIVIDGPAGQAEALLPPVKSPVTFTAPEGWKETAGNAMRLASLEATPEQGPVDVSVTRMGGGGSVLENVNRWRQQVKLDPLTEEALKSELSEIEVSGQTGTYVEAIGPEQSILAVIVPEGNSKWFFKAQGSVAAIDAERDRFKQFLGSVRLQAPQN